MGGKGLNTGILRPILFIAGSFALAALAASFLLKAYMWGLFGFALIAVLILAQLLLFNKHKVSWLKNGGGYRVIVILLLIAIGAAMGFFSSALRESLFPSDIFDGLSEEQAALLQENATLTGRITEVCPLGTKARAGESTNANRVRYKLAVTELSSLSKASGRVCFVYANADTLHSYGDTVNIPVKCLPPLEGMTSFYRQEGVSFSAFSTGEASLALAAPPTPLALIKQFNLYLTDIVSHRIKEPYAGLLQAMLLGDTSELDPNTAALLTRSGIRHAFSVSGLHISILSSLLLLLLRLLPIPIYLRNPLALLGVWVMVGLTGFGLPACRAGILLTAFLSAPLFFRQSDGLAALSAGGLLLLLANPFAVLSPSFLLTMTATGGILVLSPRLASFLIDRLRSVSWLHTLSFNKAVIAVVSALCVSIAASIATLPIILLSFKGMSVIAPVTNLLLAPLLPFLLVLGIFLLVLSPLPFLAIPLAAVIEAAFSFLLFASEALSKPRLSYIGLDYSFVPVFLCGAAIGILVWRLFSHRKVGYARITAARVTALLTAAFCILGGIQSAIFRDTLTLKLISDKNGGALILSSRAKASVISFGDSQFGTDNGNNVFNYLQGKNIAELTAYIQLEPSASSLIGNPPLSSFYPPSRQYMYANDTRLGNLAMSEELVILPYGGYRLEAPGKTLSITVFSTSLGNAVWIKAGEKTILCTQSREIAEKVPCDLLYFYNTEGKNIEQIPAECVILLNETDFLKELTLYANIK